VKAEDYTTLKERYGDDVLGVIGDLCRSMIIPAPGHRFIIGDFSMIEPRVLAFLAGDADKLEAFRVQQVQRKTKCLGKVRRPLGSKLY
jgi:DNA polymerase